MKLRILKKYKNKILHLNLLKLKLYKKNQFFNHNVNSKKTELNLKKILHIIYEYHVKNKKILFLEFPKSFKYLLKNTKHILIPKNSFYNEILNNKIINLNNSNTILKNKIIPLNTIRILSQLNKKVDLIVIYNLSSINIYNTIIQKSYKSKTPIIYCLNKFNINKLETKITYKIATTYKSFNEKILNNNFIITMIKITLKKAIASKIQQYLKKKQKIKKKNLKYKNHITNFPIKNTKNHNYKYSSNDTNTSSLKY